MRNIHKQPIENLDEALLTASIYYENMKQLLPVSKREEWNKFVIAISKSKGVKNLDKEWSNEECNRHGWETDVPGITAEMMAIVSLAKNHDMTTYEPVMDKQGQLLDRVDFKVEGKSYQCKAVRFNSWTLIVEPSWFLGKAKYLVLVDIDYKEVYVVERNDLASYYYNKKKPATINVYIKTMSRERDKETLQTISKHWYFVRELMELDKKYGKV